MSNITEEPVEEEIIPEIDVEEKPGKWAIGSFVDMPMHLRVAYCEVLVYMSDYQQAEIVLDQLMDDFKADKMEGSLRVKAPDMIRFVSIAMYLLPKLKRYQDCVDFGESCMTCTDLMSRCNPLALFYIFEYTRKDKKLIEILQFESEEYKEVKARFFSLRLQIRT